jgi:hypothetical protein
MHSYAEARVKGIAQPQAEDAAYEAWVGERDHELFRWVKVKTEKTALQHLSTACMAWERGVLPQLGDPVYVEQHFSLPFFEAVLPDPEYGLRNGTEVCVDLEGTIDYGDWSVKDWKTCSDPRKYQGGYGGEGWQLRRWGIQPTVYCWAARELGDLSEPLSFSYAAVEKTQPNVHWLEVTRTQSDFDWLKRLCWNVVKMLESDLDEWPLNDQSALCSEKWCPAWDACKGSVLDTPQLSAMMSATSPTERDR